MLNVLIYWVSLETDIMYSSTDLLKNWGVVHCKKIDVPLVPGTHVAFIIIGGPGPSTSVYWTIVSEDWLCIFNPHLATTYTWYLVKGTRNKQV